MTALVGAVIVITLIVREIRGRGHEKPVNLPKGADAALWSIVEAVPDPRNHLALTRDLSGEVRITDQDRVTATALAADRPTVARQPVRVSSAVAVIERPVATTAKGVSTGSDTVLPEPDPDTAESDEREITAQFFFAGEPRLTRF